MRIHQPFFTGLFLFSAFLLNTAALRADDVTEQVEEAMQAYKEKDYVMAAQGLEAAAQMIRQKRGQGLSELFPDAPKGWQAEEATSMAAGAALFGGGTSASREYRKGDSIVTIQFIADSPMLQSILMMFSNPMIAGASGARLERISGQRAMLNEADLNLHVVVGGSLLVSIEGDTCTADDLRLFAKSIDFSKLAASL